MGETEKLYPPSCPEQEREHYLLHINFGKTSGLENDSNSICIEIGMVFQIKRG
jgi:hypothetical protein